MKFKIAFIALIIANVIGWTSAINNANSLKSDLAQRSGENGSQVQTAESGSNESQIDTSGQESSKKEEKVLNLGF
ncbi:MAG: hypothetical protein WC834_05185 [Eubacteriales bacterium]